MKLRGAATLPAERVIDRDDTPFGACLVCGATDGCTVYGGGYWFYCQRHRVRWRFGADLTTTARWLAAVGVVAHPTPDNFARFEIAKRVLYDGSDIRRAQAATRLVEGR
jgi:hypothetical protein